MQARTLDIPTESYTKNVHQETRAARTPPAASEANVGGRAQEHRLVRRAITQLKLSG
jgi:hypothetical protein